MKTPQAGPPSFSHPSETNLDLPPEFTKFPVKKRRFLIRYAECGTITHAARHARISRPTVAHWREKDPQFAACFDVALEMSCDAMEVEARRRGYEGVLEPVFHHGQRVGVIRKYSDVLLIFMLKANRPKKFRDNIKIDANVTGGVLCVSAPSGSSAEWAQQFSRTQQEPT